MLYSVGELCVWQKAPLLTQAPANGLGKAVEDDPSVWPPAIHTGDLVDTPDFEQRTAADGSSLPLGVISSLCNSFKMSKYFKK